MASELNALLLLLLRGLLPVRQTQADMKPPPNYFITDISAIALLQLQNIVLKRNEADYDSH